MRGEFGWWQFLLGIFYEPLQKVIGFRIRGFFFEIITSPVNFSKAALYLGFEILGCLSDVVLIWECDDFCDQWT